METAASTGSTRWQELVVNKIGFSEPFDWLSKGWQDMRSAGRYSFVYGAAIVLISGLLTLILVTTGKQFLLPFLVSGFFLVAPAVGIGLYQMSSHLERGEPLSALWASEFPIYARFGYGPSGSLNEIRIDARQAILVAVDDVDRA